MISIDFIVHRANETTVNKTVELDGTNIVAAVPCFEVELVSVDCGTSYTHRFTLDIDAAKKTFVVGKKVTFSIS